MTFEASAVVVSQIKMIKYPLKFSFLVQNFLFVLPQKVFPAVLRWWNKGKEKLALPAKNIILGDRVDFFKKKKLSLLHLK